MKKISFENLTVNRKIEKINEFILNLPFEQKIDVCENCRHRNGDFKIYDKYIEDYGLCRVCFQTKEVINYTVIQLIEKAEISTHEHFIYKGLRKSLDYEIGCRMEDDNRERINREMSDEHIKLYRTYKDFGVTEEQLTPLNKKTRNLMSYTYLFLGFLAGILIYAFFDLFSIDTILLIIQTIGYIIIVGSCLYDYTRAVIEQKKLRPIVIKYLLVLLIWGLITIGLRFLFN